MPRIEPCQGYGDGSHAFERSQGQVSDLEKVWANKLGFIGREKYFSQGLIGDVQGCDFRISGFGPKRLKFLKCKWKSIWQLALYRRKPMCGLKTWPRSTALDPGVALSNSTSPIRSPYLGPRKQVGALVRACFGPLQNAENCRPYVENLQRRSRTMAPKHILNATSEAEPLA